MAKTTKENDKIAPIRPLEPSNSVAVADPDPPETPFDADEPAPSPAQESTRPGRGRPRKDTPPPDIPKVISFMDRMKSIAPEDWGTRAKIRLYRLAPIIDRLRTSEKKFLTIYEEPIDEHRIKEDYGSGRYRLYLGFTYPTQGEKQLDAVEMDILDMNYPPKVPPGEWVDDHRNKQWSWAKKFFPPDPATTPATTAPATGIGDFVEVLRATSDIRREIREEIGSTAQPPTPTPNAPTPAPPPTDPFETARRIMEMRSNDPMVTLLVQRLDRQDAALEEARKREFALQREILDTKINGAQPTAPAQPKTLVEQVKELISVKDALKEAFPGFGDSASGVHRSAKWGWIDAASELIERASPIVQPLFQGLGNYLTVRANPAAATQAAPLTQSATGAGVAETTNDTLRFVQEIVTPPMCEYFATQNDGDAFAEWLEDGYPGRVRQLQMFGPDRIMQLYQNHAPAEVKATLFKHGPDPFRKFVEQFCAWRPDEDVPAPVPDVIDLDAADEDEKEHS